MKVLRGKRMERFVCRKCNRLLDKDVRIWKCDYDKSKPHYLCLNCAVDGVKPFGDEICPICAPRVKPNDLYENIQSE
jgi:hypothetical protein